MQEVSWGSAPRHFLRTFASPKFILGRSMGGAGLRQTSNDSRVTFLHTLPERRFGKLCLRFYNP